MLIDIESFPDYLTDIYYLANMPSNLYNAYLQNQYVQLLTKHDTIDLIMTFNNWRDKPITTLKEMAAMYVILVAITQKPLTETKEFLEEVKEISYEWFSDIVNLYFNNYKSEPIITNITFAQEPVITSQIIY